LAGLNSKDNATAGYFVMMLYVLVPHFFFMLLYRQHVRLEHLDKELVSHLPTNPSKDSKALQERMWVCHAKLMIMHQNAATPIV